MDLGEARFKLNKDIPIPLYYQVKRMILNELANGSLKLGDKLPAEIEFCESLQLSRPTVRLALNELVAEGILIRKKRSGTFVAEPKIELDRHLGIEQFRRKMQGCSYECTVEVLDLCVVDRIDEISQRLELSSSDRLIYLKRMWRLGETPIVYNATYLSESKFQLLLGKDFSELSLFEVLDLNYQIHARRRAVKVEAVLASKNDIELLEIDRTRASLLYVADLVCDGEEQPVCWSISRYRGDKVFLSYSEDT